MKTALMVVTDGRDYFWETMESFGDAMDFGSFDQRLIIDDSLNPIFQALVAEKYPEFTVSSATEKRGFGGAIQAGWGLIDTDIDYVFHLEDDFVVTRYFDLEEMIATLERNPYLLQMTLLRGPANHIEAAAGGIIQQHPDSYEERTDGQATWRQHRRFFTSNPSVYPRRVVDFGWPDGPSSEGIFGIERFAADQEAYSAYWGDFDSGVWIEHIGHIRQGEGY